MARELVEIAGAEAPVVRGEVHAAAADGIGIRQAQTRLGLFLGGLPPGLDMRRRNVAVLVVDDRTEFVVLEIGARVLLPLLEQHNVVAHARELARHRTAGRPGADHHEVHGVVRVESPALRSLECDHASPPSSARRFAGWSYHENGGLNSIASSCPRSFQPTKSLLPP